MYDLFVYDLFVRIRLLIIRTSIFSFYLLLPDSSENFGTRILEILQILAKKIITGFAYRQPWNVVWHFHRINAVSLKVFNYQTRFFTMNHESLIREFCIYRKETLSIWWPTFLSVKKWKDLTLSTSEWVCSRTQES